MAALVEWLKKLVGTVVVFGFLELILPEGEMQRFVRVVLGLLVLLVMLQPLAALIRQSPDLDRILAGTAPTVRTSAPAEVAAGAARVAAAGLAALEDARRAAMERDISELTGGAQAAVSTGRDGQLHVVVRPRNKSDPAALRRTIASRYGLPETAIEVRMDD